MLLLQMLLLQILLLLLMLLVDPNTCAYLLYGFYRLYRIVVANCWPNCCGLSPICSWPLGMCDLAIASGISTSGDFGATITESVIVAIEMRFKLPGC